MQIVCNHSPNLNFLFAAMSLFNLREGGEMVYILPKSWASEVRFARFREYLLEHGKLTDIHVFTGSAGARKNILHYFTIIKVQKKHDLPDRVRITSSADCSIFDDATQIYVPYSLLVTSSEKFVRLVTSQEEIEILKKIHYFKQTMPEIGLKLKSGIVNSSYVNELLAIYPEENATPLFSLKNMINGRVVFPVGKEDENIKDEKINKMRPNRNYLFIKTLTHAEDRRNLQCAVYLASQCPQNKTISIGQNISFIDTIDGTEMSDELVYGLFTVMNSSLYEKYYSFLKSSSYITTTEVNAIPVPVRTILEQLGRKMMTQWDYSTDYCDSLLEEVFNF